MAKRIRNIAGLKRHQEVQRSAETGFAYQRSHNPEVGGSSPSPATKVSNLRIKFASGRCITGHFHVACVTDMQNLGLEGRLSSRRDRAVKHGVATSGTRSGWVTFGLTAIAAKRHMVLFNGVWLVIG
jgi:hypothetical protein